MLDALYAFTSEEFKPIYRLTDAMKENMNDTIRTITGYTDVQEQLTETTKEQTKAQEENTAVTRQQTKTNQEKTTEEKIDKGRELTAANAARALRSIGKDTYVSSRKGDWKFAGMTNDQYEVAKKIQWEVLQQKNGRGVGKEYLDELYVKAGKLNLEINEKGFIKPLLSSEKDYNKNENWRRYTSPDVTMSEEERIRRGLTRSAIYGDRRWERTFTPEVQSQNYVPQEPLETAHYDSYDQYLDEMAAQAAE